jgi:hypothetical protein
MIPERFTDQDGFETRPYIGDALVLALRVAHAQDAAISGEGGQLGDLELVYETFEARIVRAVQF